MFRKSYYVTASGIVWGNVQKLTKKQAEALRAKGYTVE